MLTGEKDTSDKKLIQSIKEQTHACSLHRLKVFLQGRVLIRCQARSHLCTQTCFSVNSVIV